MLYRKNNLDISTCNTCRAICACLDTSHYVRDSYLFSLVLGWQIVCRTCGRLFQTAAGLGRHTQSSQTCTRPVVAEEIISTRYRPTLDIGGLAAWQRRVKMATWVAGAWVILREDTSFLRASFVSTGFLVALDGSEDHKIRIPGVPQYNFRS